MNEEYSKCVICGKEYHSCLSCKEQKELKPWKLVTDSIEHYKIFLVLKDYSNEKITKEDAKEKLSNINYNIKELKKNVREDILKILKEEKSKSTKVKKECVGDTK